MEYIFEPIITCKLWKILEEKLGLEVGGEVKISPQGRVDLVAKDPTGEYVGIEVKDFSRIRDDSKRELYFVDQILKYMTSGYFDYFYVCVPKEDVPSLEIALKPQRYLSPVFWFNYPEKYERFQKYGGYLDSCGILSVPIKNFWDWNVQFVDLIVKWPKQLTRYMKPRISQMNETRIRFDIWNHFTKIKDNCPICEGVLPNPEGEKPQLIDVMVFIGTTSPTEILKNQRKFDLVGIEAKNDLRDVKSIIKQLNSYLKSGGLTKLYLAVPPKLEKNALNILEKISDVGLIIAERTVSRVKKESKKLEMKYDSILIEQVGFQAYLGYPTKVSRQIIKMGWGTPLEKPNSPYKQ